MFQRKWMVLILALVLMTSLLAGCGASATMNSVQAEKVWVDEYAGDYLYDSANGMVPEATYAANEESKNTTTSGGLQNQKLVRTMYVEAETDDLDALLANLDASGVPGEYMELADALVEMFRAEVG